MDWLSDIQSRTDVAPRHRRLRGYPNPKDETTPLCPKSLCM
jgi:hypothetical protein